MTDATPAVRADARASREPIESALEALVAAGDAIARAVELRDLGALDAATRDAERVSERLRAAIDAAGSADGLTPGTRALLERARAGARRNAMLIEHAWAIDAATLRLLAGLGRATGATAGYTASAPAAHLERRA